MMQGMLLQAVPFDLDCVARIDPLHVLVVLLLQGQRDLHQSKLMDVLVVVYRSHLLPHIGVLDEESLHEIFEPLA